ncbi:hypothetical protein F0919_03270 [Taibaiella lutea]|uniref:DUF4846 domain-containing protein n=1 Tax=Taibaiella lutea TaxID=2608001 RepID=A0A5M6CNJ0_9BACT|nr:DUF4846 domain-containing protein [Taibaiella lutea]KAA5536704.1 hypothetical protein F0919_03270 [Taibaiella lutea]
MKLISLITFLLSSCTQTPSEYFQQHNNTPDIRQKLSDLPLPKGYKRIIAGNNSFAVYARNIQLKSDNTVYLFSGIKKGNQSAQYAVLNIDVGNKDLQQCADAAMRLRAEYLFSQNRYNDIKFQFTNGFLCDFEHYANGYRVKFNGNNCSWIKQTGISYTHATLRKYLDLVYSYAGTKSLYNQMKPVSFSKIEPGDVLLQKREPYGHAVTVMDMAYNPQTKDTIFLLSQSYMPAQDIHILRNQMNDDLSPWYSVNGADIIETPEWTFTKNDLKFF